MGVDARQLAETILDWAPRRRQISTHNGDPAILFAEESGQPKRAF